MFFHTGEYRPLYVLPLSVMAGMKNGVCVVQGEVALLLSAMRRSSRWTGHARSVSERREGGVDVCRGGEAIEYS